MNYILRESFDGKSLSIRPDGSGRIVNAHKTENTDVGDNIVFLEGRNKLGTTCKDVWLSSNLDRLIDKGKEISQQYGLELKLSKQLNL